MEHAQSLMRRIAAHDQVTGTPLKMAGGELRCSRRVSSSCSISGISRVILVTNPVINREVMTST